MIVEGWNDVEAADAPGAPANDPARADRIAAGLIEHLAADTVGQPARRRLTRALADIPGPRVTRAPTEPARDGDRAVALTAAYLLGLREARRGALFLPVFPARTVQTAREAGVPVVIVRRPASCRRSEIRVEVPSGCPGRSSSVPVRRGPDDRGLTTGVAITGAR
ncbi:hypothetical protein GCM10027160_04740 [Streptomyces calidiresistens]|uniref:hypothetical protein n=1 Tax=Streptomyces calidiresistens TaxID=1485586 RepID=UPI002B21ED31|nr:hypothetical protein [Streptomyces calidiresistens]